MEEKTEVFDFQDKNNLFGRMSPLHDGVICELRQTESSFFLHCIELEGLCDPDGKPSFNGFSEAEVEFFNPTHAYILLFDGQAHKEFTSEQLFAFLKKKKTHLEMLGWSLESDGERLRLECLCYVPRNGSYFIDIWIHNPKRITYRWK